MKNLFIFSSALLFTAFCSAQEAPGPSRSQEGNQPGLMDRLSADDDSKFAMDTAESNTTQIEFGKLATERASLEDLKHLAAKIVEDHVKANDELKALANEKKIPLPSDAGMRNEAIKKQLATLSGDDFDKAYVRLTMRDHQHDIEAFKKQSQNGKDPDLRNFAAKMLPQLEEHLQLIRQIKKKMNRGRKY